MNIDNNGGISFGYDTTVQLADEVLSALEKRELQVSAARAEFVGCEDSDTSLKEVADHFVLTVATADAAYNQKIQEISARYISVLDGDLKEKIRGLGWVA